MSDDTNGANGAELDFEIVTNFKQLAPARKLRRKEVILREVKTSSGKASKWFCYELTALAFAEWREAPEQDNADLRFLAATLGDQNGNRLFPTFEAIKAALGQFGRSSLNPLVAASNEMNFTDPSDAEKNSETTPSDSSPSS